MIKVIHSLTSWQGRQSAAVGSLPSRSSRERKRATLRWSRKSNRFNLCSTSGTKCSWIIKLPKTRQLKKLMTRLWPTLKNLPPSQRHIPNAVMWLHQSKLWASEASSASSSRRSKRDARPSLSARGKKKKQRKQRSRKLSLLKLRHVLKRSGFRKNISSKKNKIKKNWLKLQQ